MKFTPAQARHLALYAQLYQFANNKDKTGALHAIQTIGYVQIDTISVVERAHHHTLYNRVQNYHTEMLDDLLTKDKTIWEFWGHAASYLPLSDYAYYKIRMQNFPSGIWEKKFWALHQDLQGFVMDRIRAEGPLQAKDFDDPREKKENLGWGDWKPAKVMLELLFLKGDLFVTARNKFQRVYDLTERIIPHYKEIEMPSANARAEFMIIRALRAHGIVSESDINKHLPIAPKETVNKALQKLLKSEIIKPVEIEGLKDTYYVFSETLEAEITDKPFDNKVRLLSPFDNTVINRSRLKQIFDFDYTIECYVTPAKRVYGYWSCPILYKNNLVGRLDPKADRKTKLFTVNSIFIDKKVWKQAAFQKEFIKGLELFMAFNGCTSYVINKINQI